MTADRSLAQVWCVHLALPQSVRIEKIVGRAVEQYLPYVKSMMDYAAGELHIHLKYIVADFIKDCNGTIWFINLQSYRVPRHSHIEWMQELGVPQEPTEPKDKIQSQGQCRLCNLKYEKEKLRRRLTMNMLIEYKKHLNQRGITLFDNFIVSPFVSAS